MSRDFTADIDRLGKQISDLRSLFADRAMDAADDAASAHATSDLQG
jgi:hypothetical protein